MTGFVGLICGLRAESDVASKAAHAARLKIAVSGANAAQAEVLAARLCAEGAAAIVSFGVSGGLAPHLKPGDLLIGKSVKTASGETFGCDPFHAAALGAGAVLFGSDNMVATAAEKARLYRETGAVAVDMESHGAARAARDAGIPFIAIRAIADPADRALPKSALGSIAPDGSMRAFSTLLKCVTAPGDFPALLQLGWDNEAALETLGRDLDRLLGALFVGLDL
ncbi:MAG: hypothetical protein ABL957_04665 [Parvularculaceae bacterium]